MRTGCTIGGVGRSALTRNTARIRSLLSILAAVWIATSSLSGQRADCCYLRADSIIVLGEHLAEPLFSDAPLDVYEDRQGRFWVASIGDPPRVFGADGQLIATLGRIEREDEAGYRNLGEFYWPTAFMPAGGDSVVVLDPLAHRVTVVGPDLRPARRVRTPGKVMRGVVLSWPDRVVGSGEQRTPSGSGWPLHLMDLTSDEATTGTSFGSGSGEILSPSEGSALNRFLIERRGGGFWAAKRPEVHFERYADDLAHAQIVEIDAQLIDGGVVSDVLVDEHDLAWVLIEPARSRPEEQPTVTRIAVVDLRTGSIEGQVTVPGRLLNFAGPMKVVRYSTTPNGGRRVEIVPLRVREPAAGLTR